MTGAALVSMALCRAGRRLGEHLAGAFGTSEDYERAYVPWDELMEKMIAENPEAYSAADLELERPHDE